VIQEMVTQYAVSGRVTVQGGSFCQQVDSICWDTPSGMSISIRVCQKFRN